MKAIITFIFLINFLSSYSQTNDIIVPFYDNGKWGYLNKNKEIVVFPKYEEVYPSFSNRLRIKLNGKYGYIDQKGKLVIKPKFIEAEDFKYGIAKVSLRHKSFNINTEGKRNKIGVAVCGTHYNCSFPKLSDDIEIIEEDGKLGIVHDKIVKESVQAVYLSDTISPIFDSIVPISHQLMYLVKDSLIAFSNQAIYITGSEFILKNLNFDYEQVVLYSCLLCNKGIHQLIGVKKNGLWGYMRIYIDPQKCIEPKYLQINSLADGFALVDYAEAKFGYIDSDGNEYFIR